LTFPDFRGLLLSPDPLRLIEPMSTLQKNRCKVASSTAEPAAAMPRNRAVARSASLDRAYAYIAKKKRCRPVQVPRNRLPRCRAMASLPDPLRLIEPTPCRVNGI